MKHLEKDLILQPKINVGVRKEKFYDNGVAFQSRNIQCSVLVLKQIAKFKSFLCGGGNTK